MKAKNNGFTINKYMLQTRSKLHEQIDYFNTGYTKDLSFRVKQLKNLKSAIKKNEALIMNALYEDLKKSNFEAFITEIGILYQEINYAIANTKKWAKPNKVKTPFALFPARSLTVPEPYGNVLIIGPWNYPFQLVIAPLIDAIAAGNTAIIKPSELAPHTSGITAKIISDTFDPSYIYVAEGGVDTTRFLLKEKFDYIFFTGGTEIGKIIMEAASKNLTPVTLELGGKSPVIVNNDTNLDMAAKKIAWGKFINAGQTCIAPDYLLVHKDIINKLISRIKHYIKEFYSEDPKMSPDYPRIINLKHYKRIKDLMRNTDIISGGETDEKQLYISPTIAQNIPLSHPLMKEEIFGPILPVLEYRTIDDAIAIIRSMPKPLALYLFTNNKKIEKRISKEISCGSLVINDTVIHVANHYLPFGGVGPSGMGAYHGKAGFDTFSHKKSVMKASGFFDLPLRYPPYKQKIGLLKSIFR